MAMGREWSSLTIVASVVLVLLVTLFVLSGVMVNPRFGGRIERRRSLARFGRVRTVDRRVVRPEADATARCAACGSRTNEGLERRYRERYVIAGVPVWTSSEGDNRYCVDCALGEMPGDGLGGKGKARAEETNRERRSSTDGRPGDRTTSVGDGFETEEDRSR